MSDGANGIPPVIALEQRKTGRVRLWVVRATIVVLAMVVGLLLWKPWGTLDDCLHCAARNGHPWMVRFYLLRGDDVNGRIGQGYTPLMDAIWDGRLDVVDLLVRHGAKLDLTDNDGRTALIWGVTVGQERIVAYLIDKGALLNKQDVDGNTAMMFAMRNGYTSIGRLLFEAGADINLENKAGETALVKAGQRGFGDMVAFLKRHGATKTNVFVGKSPYPVKPLPQERLWALATAALLDQYNGDSHELLGSRPASDHTWARIGLRDWWGINNPRQAMATLDQLQRTGQRQRYRQEDSRSRRTPRSRAPYLAWDYCRLVWVTGVSYVAGYLTEEQAWQRIMPAARAIQANYSSWQEMGEDYLRGRKRWNGRNDPQFLYIFQLLTNSNDPTSPWTKCKWGTDLSGRDTSMPIILSP